MVSFNSAVNLLFFLMICLTINIVHGNPKDNDLLECLRQIRVSFNNCKTARQCYAHAVRYYKKGDYITDDGTLIPGTSEPSENIAVSDIDYRGFDGQSSSLEGTSETSENIADQQNNNSSFIEQFDEEEDLSQYVDNFYGLKDFIEKDANHILINEQQSPPSDHQYPPNYATTYLKELENMAQGTNIIPPVSYCFKYFKRNCDPLPRSAEERAVLLRQGRGNQDCLKSLKIFGRTPKSAATVALKKFRLAECTNHYVQSFMQYIITELDIRKPSKSPKTFCNEIYKDEDWYLKLKGLK